MQVDLQCLPEVRDRFQIPDAPLTSHTPSLLLKFLPNLFSAPPSSSFRASETQKLMLSSHALALFTSILHPPPPHPRSKTSYPPCFLLRSMPSTPQPFFVFLRAPFLSSLTHNTLEIPLLFDERGGVLEEVAPLLSELHHPLWRLLHRARQPAPNRRSNMTGFSSASFFLSFFLSVLMGGLTDARDF